MVDTTSRATTRYADGNSSMGRDKEATLIEKLAACLLMITDENGWPLIPIDRVKLKTMSAEEIFAMVEFHHVVSKRMGGSNHPTNLDPMLKPEHREYEAKIGAKVHAKADRFERLRKTGTKRTAAQQRRYKPIQSRPFMTPEDRAKLREKYGSKTDDTS